MPQNRYTQSSGLLLQIEMKRVHAPENYNGALTDVWMVVYMYIHTDCFKWNKQLNVVVECKQRM